MMSVWVLSHGACVWPRGLAPTQWSPATAGKTCWDFIAVKHYVRPLALPHPSWALPLNKPVSFAIYGFRAFQCILFGQWMKKVTEACTCGNKSGLAFHWEFLLFTIGFSYGTCYQEAKFGFLLPRSQCLLSDGHCWVDRGEFNSEGNTATGNCNQSTHSEINAKLKAKLKSTTLSKLCRRHWRSKRDWVRPSN